MVKSTIAESRNSDADEADESEEIIFKPYHWDFEDHDEGKSSYTEIKISGHSPKNETIYISVKDFRPYVYLELPSEPLFGRKPIVWTKEKRKRIFDYFKEIMKDRAPLKYEAVKRNNLYYEEPFLALKLFFRTQKDSRFFSSRCLNHKGIYVEGLGTFPYGSLKVHEHTIDPILKFTAAKDLPLADWIKCTRDVENEEMEKFSTAKIDAFASWKNFEKYNPPDLLFTRHSYLSFDIECYSKNHVSKKPDPLIPENVVFQIAGTFGIDGDKATRKKYLLTLFDPHDRPGVIDEIRRFKNEKGLIKGFAKLVRETDPDALYGYNTMKFDWDYLIARAKLSFNDCLEELQTLSRTPFKACKIKTSSWSSNAYGDQNFSYLDPEGRINIDVLTEVQRNWKLTKYSLDFVSEYFLGEHKDPVSPRQLFMLYDLTNTFLGVARNLPEEEVEESKRIEIKKKVQKILKRRWCTGPTLKLRTKIMGFETGAKFLYLVRKALTITGIYNVRDTILPLDISDKLGLWNTMEQTANTMQVPMSYLHTRGQQIKVVAQVHRDTNKRSIVIPHIPKDQIKIDPYMGATVIDTVPGDYEDILIFDFESLYPSMMISANICYTTLIKEGDPISDEECHLIKRIEHRGCEHDKSGKKVNKDDILCCDKIYRFRKVVYLPDGTRLYEGLMPALERNLLKTRKDVKREMAKAEAKINCTTGKATDDDRKYFRSQGWEAPEVGELSADQLEILKMYAKILNARQLSLKVSANSAYGILGAQKGFIPFVPGASSVTAMGRTMIRQAIQYILKTYKGEVSVNENGDSVIIGESKLVYGDTDSCLIERKGYDPATLWKKGGEMAKATTHFLKTWWLGIDEDTQIICPLDNKSYRIDKYPRGKDDENIKALDPKSRIVLYEYLGCPINLQIENYYKRLLLLTKKRYMTHIVNGEGKLIGKGKKGTVTVRREQCQFVRDTYDQVSTAMLEKVPEEKVLENFLKRNYDLCSGMFKDAFFIMYKGISDVIAYAKTDKNGKYIDCDGNEIKNPVGPLDPRLVYSNIAHVNLARKMIRRGDDVVPNSRMEYVYLEDPTKTLDSDRTEDYTYFQENKKTEDLKLDYFYYQKQLIKPLSELFGVIYKKDKILYEDLEVSIERELRKQEKSCIFLIEKMPRKVVYEVHGKGRVYTYTKLSARYQNILQSIKLGETDEEHLQSPRCDELRNLILRWKSRFILKSLHKKFGSRARPIRAPSNRNRVLRIQKDGEPEYVMLSEGKGSKYPRGTLVKLISRDEDPSDLRSDAEKKKNPLYYYTVQTLDQKTFKDLSRSELAPFYVRDSNFVKQIHLAHKGHAQYCAELYAKCEPLRKVLG